MHRFTSPFCGSGPVREANDGRRRTLSRSSATPGFQARNRRPDWVRLTGVVFILFPSPLPCSRYRLAKAKTIAPMRPKLNYCADVRSASPARPDWRRHCHTLWHPACRHGAGLAGRRTRGAMAARTSSGSDFWPRHRIFRPRLEQEKNDKRTTAAHSRRRCHRHPLHCRGSCRGFHVLRRTNCRLPRPGDPSGGAVA